MEPAVCVQRRRSSNRVTRRSWGIGCLAIVAVHPRPCTQPPDGRRVHARSRTSTDWPTARIEALRRVLRDEPLVRADELFTVETSLPHGHVEAILGLMRHLGVDTLIASKRSRARDLVLAMIVERLIDPCSKLATTRCWSTTTLGESLGVADADVDELYAALDWLLARQPPIEQKLARRHLAEGGIVLYDVSSSYYEGRTCPLARFGHDRDGKTGLPIIVYGVMTDSEGGPVADRGLRGERRRIRRPCRIRWRRCARASGWPGRAGRGSRDAHANPDRSPQEPIPGSGGSPRCASPAIRALGARAARCSCSLFDQQHLAEITSPAYPGERLVACFNPLLAEERHRKREELARGDRARVDDARPRRPRAARARRSMTRRSGRRSDA